ncbi:uncharacterized protein LOC120180647 [Hibiscus syriacus]|uniref:uncharacterized protein LOC120180647 n=1 Tax=Hibiscus syriacus TaxID=106335 RepID=UPI001923A04C|nr:uncharacterized protein LOC120180647 [Hibiscus syriacus]
MRPAISHLFADPCRELNTRQGWEDMGIVVLKVLWHSLVWFPGHIPKHILILWMIVLDRLPTRARLMRMGLAIESDKCLLCDIEPETRNRIFFVCGHAKALWGVILSLCGINRGASSWNGELAWAIHYLKGSRLLSLSAITQSVSCKEVVMYGRLSFQHFTPVSQVPMPSR